MNPYTLHIKFYELAFLGTGFIGLTFILLLWFAKKSYGAASRFLALALLSNVLQLVWPLLQYLLTLGPFIYFYTLKTTRPHYKFRLKDMVHFCPLLLQQGMLLLKVKESGALLQLLVFISVITYLYASHRLIERFYRGLKFNAINDRYRYELRWLHRFLMSFGGLWLLCIPCIALNYFYYHHRSGIYAYHPLYLLSAMMMIWIAAAAFLRSDTEGSVTPVLKPPSPAILKQKGVWLKKVMEENLYYQDPDLSLRSLAETLHLQPNELSRIINTAFRKNFNDFINEYRIREVTRKMQDPAYDRLTLLGIAMDAGFNSKSTFNRTFRQLIGESPAEYKSRLEKERPSYTLRPYYKSLAVISYHETTPKWSSGNLNRNFMLKNYFKIAWRNLIKNKSSSIINIGGLAVGMAVAMLIGLWIYDELSFDKYHKNYDRIGQIMTTQTSNGMTQTFPSTVVPLSNELRFKYSGSFKRVALTSEGAHILAIGDKKISQTGMFAERDMPAILSLVMIKGSYEAFTDPTSLLMSASVAKALFGDKEPINKLVRIDNDKTMKVIGVYEDLPHNTSFNQILFMLPWNSPTNRWNTPSPTWDNHGCQLYTQLNANISFDRISTQIRDITKPHFKINDETVQVSPMAKWHLYSQFQNGKSVGGRITFLRLFGTIGIFVLLLACINFMNLSTARSEKKAKEVGIRKAIGSHRSQLIKQFLSESMLVVFLAFVLTIGIVLLAIPYFNNIADKQVALPWGNPLFWLISSGFVVVTGFVSGSYPAFYLSAFKPIKVLKGTFKVGRLAALPRKVLVVVQFTVSIALIIGTIIIYRQIQFASNRPIGYSREGLITVQMNTPEIYGHYEAMRNELIQTGAVVNMAESNSSTTQIWSNNSGFNWEGQEPGYNPSFGTIAVTTDFGSTVGWKILEGRDFSKNYVADTGAFILNESALRLSGIKDPIGKIMRWQGKDHVITGVVKDIVMESPYKPTVATIFHMQPDWVNVITIRVNPKIPMQTALNKIALVFKAFNPGSPFSYKFIDDEYAKKFSDEQRIGRLATVFGVLAIFISCLGLFGMSSFMAEQRIREIGVRKVLGASVFNLWRLLSKDFVLLIFIAILIATPLAYYFMYKWLQGYQYRTEITWWIFTLTGLGAMVITLLTVSYQSIKAALANPVKSLKME